MIRCPDPFRKEHRKTSRISPLLYAVRKFFIISIDTQILQYMPGSMRVSIYLVQARGNYTRTRSCDPLSALPPLNSLNVLQCGQLLVATHHTVPAGQTANKYPPRRFLPMAPPEVNADYYTTLPRARRTSLPSSNLRNSIRINHRVRAASTSYSPMRPLFNHASVTHTSRPDIRSQNAQNARVKPRPYTKPDPDAILPEIKKLLGDFPASAPPQQQIRDFLDVDEILALHDRDIMDRREREDHRGARNDQGLST